MSHVFISGIAGFLGSHLADLMLKRGHTVSGCDNLCGGERANVPDGVQFHVKDCSSFKAMSKLLKDVDVVYHCAAAAYEGLSIFSPTYITKNIVQASVSMITASIGNGVKRFVFCSSMARYGDNEVPFAEDMQTSPVDPYGIGKVAVEQILKVLSEVHGMEYVIAVPHNIIGARQKWDDPYRNVASIMINLMLQGRQPIIYGDGKQKRCFSFVGDVVEPLELLGFESDMNGEIFNLGPDSDFITIDELTGTIAKLLGVKLYPIYTMERPMEVKLANCSADKARKRLGYEPKVSLEDGLLSIIEHIRIIGTKSFSYHVPLEICNERTPRTWTERLF